MGRHVDPRLFGPAGICDACGAKAHGMHQVGSACYMPGCAGVMQHRSLWVYSWWPDGTMTATPRDDLTESDVAAVNADHLGKR